jgi:hypothetical protein
MADNIVARFIIQIAGKPVENVEKALNFISKKINDDKKYKVLDSHVADPELEKESTIYVGFLDIEIKFKEAKDILDFIMDYTPSSVEVIEPENIKFTNNELTGILNDMSSNILDTLNKVRHLNAHVHMLNKKIEELEKK